MIQQMIERRSPVKTTARLIFLAACTPFCFGTAGATNPPESQVPAGIREACKTSYFQFNSPPLAQFMYDACIDTYRNLKFPGESQVPPELREMCKVNAIFKYV